MTLSLFTFLIISLIQIIQDLFANFIKIGAFIGTVLLKCSSSSFLYWKRCFLSGRKRGVWESLLRVPAIMQWKGRIQGGQIIHSAVTSMDLLPTVLEAIGQKRKQLWVGWQEHPTYATEQDCGLTSWLHISLYWCNQACSCHIWMLQSGLFFPNRQDNSSPFINVILLNIVWVFYFLFYQFIWV